MLKRPKVRNVKHRKFIASLPCAASGVEGRTQCAHIRFGTGGGMGMKPSDLYCVPLSVESHAEQHRVGEKKFWGEMLDLAIELAARLYIHTGDYVACRKLIDQFRWKMFGEKSQKAGER